jgi:uncharacterized protein YdaU (DUF1376 family)
MKKLPYFPLYARDFYLDTADWTCEEIGAYLRLLLYQWENGYIPSNVDRLTLIVGLNRKKLNFTAQKVLKKFAKTGRGKLANLRLEREREKLSKYYQTQELSGKRGADKRWGRLPDPNGDPIGDPNGNPNGESIALHLHLQNSTHKSTLLKRELADKSANSRSPRKPKEPIEEGKAGAEIEAEFEEFWGVYDYKVKRQDAFKAYKHLRLAEGVEKGEIAKALNGYHDFLRMRKERENFEQAKMYPSTFLRGGRWKDYVGIVYKAQL